jgi:Flp pilus assembly protein TadG
MRIWAAQRASGSDRRRKGSVAVEFALVGPLLIFMLMAMTLYGGWYWLAQGVQSLATEAARSAVAGLDPDERQRLAEGFIAAEAQPVYGFAPDDLDVQVEAQAEQIRVRVVYDATGHPLMALAALIPAPPGRIERSAVVRMGGFV